MRPYKTDLDFSDSFGREKLILQPNCTRLVKMFGVTLKLMGKTPVLSSNFHIHRV